MLSCLIFSFLKGPKHVAAAESFFFLPRYFKDRAYRVQGAWVEFVFPAYTWSRQKIALDLPYSSNLKVVRSISTSYQDGP